MANKKINPDDFEEKDSNWESFVEIATSVIKIGIFLACIYMFSKIFLLATDMYYLTKDQSIEIIQITILPIAILIILAMIVIFVLKKL